MRENNYKFIKNRVVRKREIMLCLNAVLPYDSDLAKKYFKEEIMGPCDLFKEGQEFIVDQSLRCPKEFCSWAWNDINKLVTTLVFGGNFNIWNKNGKKFVACCTDGIKPVIFELERIDD